MEKTVIITGANSGIGKAAALQFASEGYRVIMACRSIPKSIPVRDEIIENTGNEKVVLLPLDISSRQSIFHFCEEYKKTYDVLDILIHNAGHFRHGEKQFQQGPDGMELTYSTNLLGPVLMTHLLSDMLARSEDPRVLNACSTNIKHFFDPRRKIDIQTLEGPPVFHKIYDSYQIYGDSKMALLMATTVMAREYQKLGISVNAIMIPATKMSKETVKKFQSYWKLFAMLQNPFIIKTELMGCAYFRICTLDRYAGVTGALINHDGAIVHAADKSMPFIKIITSSKFYPSYGDDEETAEVIWNICQNYIHTSKSDIPPA